MPRAREFPFEKNKKLRLQDLEEISPIKFLRALVYVNQTHIRKYLEEHVKGAGGELPLHIFSESEDFFSCSFMNSGYRVFINIEDKREIILTLSDTNFIIEDNCGGIPKNKVEELFSFGISIHQTIGGIGSFGMGGKRAIFKIGRDICLESDDGKDYWKQ